MILRTFCPFFVFLFVKYLCLPERRLVIGYIYKREDCNCRYDDSIVRQMVGCIKVYADKHIEVIFGGGYAVEETVERLSAISRIIIA